MSVNDEINAAYQRGDNVAALAMGLGYSESDAIRIAYNMQSGTYIDQDDKPGQYYTRQGGQIVEHETTSISEYRRLWAAEIDMILQGFYRDGLSILEAGVGEATTLRYLAELNRGDNFSYSGCDLSSDRIAHGLKYLSQNDITAKLFVADIYDLPVCDNAYDVVYTSHSIEPNGYRGEARAIAELYRVAREAVVLVEPDWNMADCLGKLRMTRNNYAAKCIDACGELGLEVILYRPMRVFRSKLNPGSAIAIKKVTK